jgi:hypothetical protein
MRLDPVRRLLCLFGAALLCGCEAQDYVIAEEAKPLLVGLSSNDLRFCAGLPDRVNSGTSGAQFWSYERSVTIGSSSLSLTQIGVSLSGAEECRVTVELVGERVSRVAFSRMAGSHALPASSSCAPLVSTCVDMIRNGLLVRTAAPPAATPAPAR